MSDEQNTIQCRWCCRVVMPGNLRERYCSSVCRRWGGNRLARERYAERKRSAWQRILDSISKDSVHYEEAPAANGGEASGE